MDTMTQMAVRLARKGATDDVIALVMEMLCALTIAPAPPPPAPTLAAVEVTPKPRKDVTNRRIIAAETVFAWVMTHRPAGIVATASELMTMAGISGVSPGGLSGRLMSYATGKRSHMIVTVSKARPPHRRHDAILWSIKVKGT